MDLDAFRAQSRQTWDRTAVGWEARRAFLERNVGDLTDWIIEQIAPAPGQVVLEVGAGPGDLGQRIAELTGPDGRVISTDFSSEMVAIARRLGAARDVGNVEYRQLDAEAMDLDDDSVDAVVGRAVHMLLGDPERVRSLVTDAGFSEPLTEQIDFVFHYADERDAWNAIVDLNGPLAVIIERLSDDERDATRRAVLDGFGPFRQPDGSYPVPAQALAVHAQ